MRYNNIVSFVRREKQLKRALEKGIINNVVNPTTNSTYTLSEILDLAEDKDKAYIIHGRKND